MMLSEPDAWLFLWAAFIFYWLMVLLESNAAGHLCFCHQQVKFDCRKGLERMLCPVWVKVQIGPVQPPVFLITWLCKMLLLVKQRESSRLERIGNGL